MSFGINGPDKIPSIQKSHHTNDGGAGNLGYFHQENKEENKEKQEETDIFESSKKKDLNNDPLLNELDSLGKKIKNFWLKLYSPFFKENPEE